MAIKKSNIEFSQLVSEKAHKFKFPARVMFELTYRCNFRCLHCYVAASKKKKQLTTTQVKNILGQLKDAGCCHIGFTGGEVFLRKDFFQILEYARINGFRISILTNGFLINKQIAKKLAGLGNSLNRVDISVLGASEKTLEKITGIKGSYKRIIRSIKLLKAMGIYVQLKATLLTLNKDEFLKIKQIAEKLKIVFRYSPSVCAKVDGNVGPLKYQVDAEGVWEIKQQLAGDKRAINDDAQIAGRVQQIGRRNLFRCGAAQTEATISPYGELNFCLEIHYPQYNILKSSFKECWEKLKGLVGEIKPPKKYLCQDCALALFCHWCPAKAWALKKDFFTCDPKERASAYEEARHSVFWKDIAPIWEKQKQRFYLP